MPGFQWVCRRLSDDHVRVLMYHRFAPGEGNVDRLGAKHFAKQLAYMAKYHRFWSADQHIDSYTAGRKVTGSPVVLTIDDGYKDFEEIVLPLLSDYEVNPILFVVPDFVSGSFWFWWDKLRHIFDETSHGRCDFQLYEKPYKYSLDNSSDRYDAWNEITVDLAQLTPEQTALAVERLAELLDVQVPLQPPQDYSAISWEQLERMAANNVTVGAHTCTHPALSRISREQAAAEIEMSREAIKARIGQCSDMFCYPYGQAEDYTPETIGIVEQLGFSGAYVAFEGNGEELGPFERPRYAVHEDWVEFRWKLCGAQAVVQKYLS